MQSSTCRFAQTLSGLSFASVLTGAALAFGASPVLKWNGGPGGLWDAATANWLDAEENAVAWQPGAEALFDGAGGLVNVAGDIAVSDITFAANGTTLLGAGRLTVGGGVSVAAAATNGIAAELRAPGGLAKTGGGALALARCAGPVAVQEGALLASGTFFADADVSVASGAALVTLGEPGAAGNLLLNAGFEDPVLGNGVYSYRDIPGWVRSAWPNFIGLKNTAASGEWALAGVSPEGVQMAIVQGGGALSQTVTVPADGLYAVAFSYMMRNQAPAKTNQVYVSLGGVPLAAFLNRAWQTAPGRFASGALWLPAGDYTLTVAGETDNGWNDCTTLFDAVCFAPPSAAEPCRALGGDSALALATGASVVLSHSGAAAAARVAVNGASVAGGFTYDASHLSGIFSGPGALAALPPENTFFQAGAGDWDDAATWQGGAAPAAGGSADLWLRLTADSANTLPGSTSARRLQLLGAGPAILAGNALTLAGPLSQPLPGAWSVSAPITPAAPAFTIDNAGDLILSQPLGIASNGLFVKSGPGTLTLAAFTNGFGAASLYGGTVSLPALPAVPAAWEVFSSAGCPAALRFTAPGTLAHRFRLYGSGFPALAVDTAGGNGTVTLSDYTVANGANAAFDVAAGDTLSLRQLLRFRASNNMASAPMLLKTGPGTLEIRSAGADTDTNRAYPGATVLRNGTLLLSEDDWGTLASVSNAFNGRTYAATGGSLGYSPFTAAVVIGDGGTAPSDHLALIANGAGRWIGHDLEVANAGSTVTLGMADGTAAAMFAGTLTLHRDIALAGPADGILSLGDIAFAPDFAGTGALALSGLGGLCFEGSLPPGLSLAAGGRTLRFGTRAVRDLTLAALTLGDAAAPATLDIDFAGTNDILRVTAPGGLTLRSAVVNLAYAGSGMPFAEPGTYILFTYAGSLAGDPAAALSVGNPQSGASYVFADDPANQRVTLTISGASGGIDAVWTRKTGGDWGSGANWGGGTVPDGAGILPLFGAAITNPATVNLEAARTVGGLVFNNAAYGYTLGGSGGLTFSASGATPAVSILVGTHTLDTALSSPGGLDVATADGTLILGPGASADTALTLTQGTVVLQGNAAVNGATTLADATLLRAASTTNAAIGTLSGPASAAVTLTGTAPALSVNQAADSTFAGTLSGPAGSTLAKNGAGTLTLNSLHSTLPGRVSVGAGTLALRSAELPAAIDIGASGTLAVGAPVTNGLTGFFYNLTPVTNAFGSLAALEAHLAGRAPDFIALSSAAGPLFDYAVGTPYAIAGPYASAGSRPTNYEAVWRGTVTVPESGTYVFGMYGDDGYLLAIDGRDVLNRTVWNASWCEANVPLQAGRHDIVIGYFQASGGGGVRVQVRRPGQSNAAAREPLPNAWLTPGTQTGALSGNGTLALPTADSVLRTTVPAGDAILGGALAGVPDARLAKAGPGIQSLGGASDAFTGTLTALAGTLTANADGALAASAALDIRSGATLALAGAQTVRSLSGDGALAIGGSVYVVPFIGDADCGITPDKTYTHLLDFPANGNPATVNGVTFTAAGTSGSVGGYAWAFSGSVPSGAINTAPDDSTRTGIDRLLWDFQYNAQGNSTITLSGLTPGSAYEMRVYFRNYANNPRVLDFTFTAGGHEVGRLTHNPDTGTRSWVGCRYLADAAGSISMTIAISSTGHTCHFYGLSNEKLAAAAPALTVAPDAGTSARFAGTVTGPGTLAIDGAGEQRFSGPLTLPNPLDVRAGTAALDSGAALPGGATVAAGATLKVPLGNVTLGALSGEGTLDLTGAADYAVTNGPHFVAITGDADCGVSLDKTYTHLLDFGGNAALADVNGVAFNKEKTVNGPTFGASWANAPANSTHAGGNPANIGVAPGQGIYDLLNDFSYNGPYGTLYLTGLTTGKTYEVRFYHRKWENSINRSTTFTFDPGGAAPVSDAISFNPDSPAGLPNDNYLAYRYVAQTNRLAVAITCPNTDKYHLYGLSNEEVPGSGDGATTLNIAGESVFGGILSGSGALVKTGAGRLLLTGASTASGPVAIAAGVFGVTFADAAPLTSGVVTFAPGTALTCIWSGLTGGTLAAGTVILPAEGFVLLAGSTGQPPPTWPVIISQDAPLAPDLDTIILQGFPASVKLRYSDDRRILYLLNPRGTLFLLQ
jgi:autotransporter-associated beta strand protein